MKEKLFYYDRKLGRVIGSAGVSVIAGYSIHLGECIQFRLKPLSGAGAIPGTSLFFYPEANTTLGDYAEKHLLGRVVRELDGQPTILTWDEFKARFSKLVIAADCGIPEGKPEPQEETKEREEKLLTDIYDFSLAIERERQHQAEKFGDGTDAQLDEVDQRNNEAMDFVGYIAAHATRWFHGGFRPYDVATLRIFRSQMIKVATLAYAAVRWADFYIAREETEGEAHD